jgi:hypothetical protein
MLRKLTLLGAGALAVMALAAGVASAKAVKATANIQGGNFACGANIESDPVLGTVKFVRKENVVKLVVKLAKGEPETVYKVQLADGFCGELGQVAEFTTNKKGVGHAKGTIAVPPEETEFFADVDPFGFAIEPGNDTPHVTLP